MVLGIDMLLLILICYLIPQFAFIYFFNLHLGQGIILLPKLISKTGLLLSTLLITAIAAVNFVTSSHVLEAMGIANALNVRQKRGLPNSHNTTNVSLHYVPTTKYQLICMLLL